MEEEVELLDRAELLEELEEVVSAEKAQPVSTLWALGQPPGLKREIQAGDNLPWVGGNLTPSPPAFFQTAALVYLANRRVCLSLEWELELSCYASVQHKNTKQKATPNKQLSGPQAPFAFLLEKSSKNSVDLFSFLNFLAMN